MMMMIDINIVLCFIYNYYITIYNNNNLFTSSIIVEGRIGIACCLKKGENTTVHNK